MKREKSFKYISYIIGLVSGILSIAFAIASIVLALLNIPYSIYTLASALVCLGFNRVGFHFSNQKRNMFINISLTFFIFVLGVLVGLTKINIYFLIVSMFLYSLTIVIDRIYKIKADHSLQSIIFNVLVMVFVVVFSGCFFMPAIYEEGATSVDNISFIVLSYAVVLIVSNLKNISFPYRKSLRIDTIKDIVRKTMVFEIITILLILIILCSIYFTIEEPNIKTFTDALWYCFSVITTIGFGDVTVTTSFGRIISVILGIYGIVVVAVFTSIIINFYNESNKKREERALKKLEQVSKELEDYKDKQEEVEVSKEEKKPTK